MNRPMRAGMIVLAGMLLSSVASADAPATRPAVLAVEETWHDDARKRDVPVRLYIPTDSSKPWQPILVTHGLGDSRRSIAYACGPWAADRFLVVAIEHPGSDWHVWDGVKNGEPLTETFRRLSAAATPENFLLRCGDVRFVLDELARLNEEGESLLFRKLDLDRIGLAGHSFGALTAQAIIGQQFAPVPGLPASFADPRVKAAVIMSPGLEGAHADLDTSFGGITVPTFHVTGTADSSPGLGITLTSRRRVPFDRSTASDRFLLIFDRGTHIVFSGGHGRGSYRALYRHIETSTARLTTEFWRYTLRGESAARDRLLKRQDTGLADADKLEHRAPTTRPAQ